MRTILVLSLAAMAIAGELRSIDARAATPEDQAIAASEELLSALRSVDGVYGVKSARVHDGTELIFAWFEDKSAVLRWFEHSYHRKLLRDAGRPEDNVAAEHFGDKVGPILVVASVAYAPARGSIHASMFDDPVAGRPTRFAIEYYTPLPGGAYMIEPFAPPGVQQRINGLRDVFDDD